MLRSGAVRLISQSPCTSASSLHQWAFGSRSNEPITAALSKLNLNHDFEGHASSCQQFRVPLTGLNRWALGQRRFGFPRGTKPKPRLYWDEKDLEKQTGGKYTHKPLIVKRLHGIDPETGRRINKHLRGGVKFDYFMVDWHRKGPSTPGSFYEERVLEVRRDFNRTPFIALVAGTNGKRWILATENMKAGEVIRTTSYIPPNPVRGKEGDAHPVGALSAGTLVNCVETYPGEGAKLIVQSGGAATIVRRHENGMIGLQYPNKREFALKPECMATVGRLSNLENKNLEIGSGAMRARMGWYTPRPWGIRRKKDGYQGRKLRPLPPTAFHDKPPEIPGESYKLTLTKRQLSGLWGSAVVDPVGGEISRWDAGDWEHR